MSMQRSNGTDESDHNNDQSSSSPTSFIPKRLETRRTTITEKF